MGQGENNVYPHRTASHTTTSGRACVGARSHTYTRARVVNVWMWEFGTTFQYLKTIALPNKKPCFIFPAGELGFSVQANRRSHTHTVRGLKSRRESVRCATGPGTSRAAFRNRFTYSERLLHAAPSDFISPSGFSFG